MRPEVMTLFRQVADLPLAERDDHYARQQVPAALRQEVESLLRYDWTDDSLRAEIASAERRLLEEPLPGDEHSTAGAHTALSHGASARALTQPERIGRFEVDRLLGRGGMGEVYLARDPVIDRAVAIKLIGSSVENETARRRLVREARTAGRLRHPNIVTIFEAGEHEAQPYIAMEYVPGETLRTLIGRHEPLPLSRKIEMIEGACAGLAHAHRAGVVHLDIKPDNLMIDDTGVVKVLDFGISRSVNTDTLTVHVAGTLRYMSPEQIQGRALDHRSDTFSLGCALFELVLYEPAFSGSTSEIVTRIAQGPVPRLSERAEGVPPELDRILGQAMSLDAAQRYADLDELRTELAAVRATLDPRAQGPIVIAPAEGAVAPSSSGVRSSTPAATAPSARSTWVLAAAIGAVLVAGAAVAFRGGLSTPPAPRDTAAIVAPDPADAPPAPAVAAPSAASSDEVWRHLARGDRAAVLARIGAVAAGTPDDRDLARSVVDAVRDNAARARAAAAAGAGTDTYQRADAQMARAERLRTSGQFADSMRAFWQADDLFARTAPAPAASAPAAVTPPPSQTAPSTADVPAPAATTPDPIPAPPITASSPAPPTATAPAARTPAVVTAPPPAPPSDRQLILETLQRYDAAYQALDVAALTRVYPSLGQSQLDQLRKTFEGMTSYEMKTNAGRVDLSGDTARVQASVARRMSPRVGAPIANEVATVFQLRRAGATWIITAVTAG